MPTFNCKLNLLPFVLSSSVTRGFTNWDVEPLREHALHVYELVLSQEQAYCTTLVVGDGVRE